jgi:hypothetical protein
MTIVIPNPIDAFSQRIWDKLWNFHRFTWRQRAAFIRFECLL